ncbi:histone-lysine N-methyltransferase 2B isoform X2 [Ambystoma mexicanum]|uniref:histone-lysine N-methyltransferase 2B isoform X2 n=1 Tax=Ambystoma mexicanum TaxID=8296 RepID=UPI0037E8F1C8
MAASGAGGGLVSSSAPIRCRFPGRPGCRWRRSRLPRAGTGVADTCGAADPILLCLLDLSWSLRRLRRACAGDSSTGLLEDELQRLPEQGDSEEEEEFVGFRSDVSTRRSLRSTLQCKTGRRLPAPTNIQKCAAEMKGNMMPQMKVRELQTLTKIREPLVQAKARQRSSRPRGRLLAIPSNVKGRSLGERSRKLSNQAKATKRVETVSFAQAKRDKHLVQRTRKLPPQPSEKTLVPPVQKTPWKCEQAEPSQDPFLAAVSPAPLYLDSSNDHIAIPTEQLPTNKRRADSKRSDVASASRRKRQLNESTPFTIKEVTQPMGRVPSSRKHSANPSWRVNVQAFNKSKDPSISPATDFMQKTESNEQGPCARRKKTLPPEEISTKPSRSSSRKKTKEAKSHKNPPVVLKFSSQTNLFPLVKACHVLLTMPLPCINMGGSRINISQVKDFRNGNGCSSVSKLTASAEKIQKSEMSVTKQNTDQDDTKTSEIKLNQMQKPPTDVSTIPKSPPLKEEVALMESSSLLEMPQKAEEPAMSHAGHPLCTEPLESLSDVPESAIETKAATLETRLLLRRSSRGNHPPPPQNVLNACQLQAEQKEAQKRPLVSQTPEEIQAVKANILKKIRKFIMPISSRSSRVIKPPRRFMDDEVSPAKKSSPRQSPENTSLHPKQSGRSCPWSLEATLPSIEGDYDPREGDVETEQCPQSLPIFDQCSTNPDQDVNKAIAVGGHYQAMSTSQSGLTPSSPISNDAQILTSLCPNNMHCFTPTLSIMSANQGLSSPTRNSDNSQGLMPMSPKPDDTQCSKPESPIFDNLQRLTFVCSNASNGQSLTPTLIIRNEQSSMPILTMSGNAHGLSHVSPSIDYMQDSAPGLPSTEHGQRSAIQLPGTDDVQSSDYGLPTSNDAQALAPGPLGKDGVQAMAPGSTVNDDPHGSALGPSDTEAVQGSALGPSDTEAVQGSALGPSDTEAVQGSALGPSDTEAVQGSALGPSCTEAVQGSVPKPTCTEAVQGSVPKPTCTEAVQGLAHGLPGIENKEDFTLVPPYDKQGFTPHSPCFVEQVIPTASPNSDGKPGLPPVTSSSDNTWELSESSSFINKQELKLDLPIDNTGPAMTPVSEALTTSSSTCVETHETSLCSDGISGLTLGTSISDKTHGLLVSSSIDGTPNLKLAPSIHDSQASTSLLSAANTHMLTPSSPCLDNEDFTFTSAILDSTLDSTPMSPTSKATQGLASLLHSSDKVQSLLHSFSSDNTPVVVHESQSTNITHALSPALPDSDCNLIVAPGSPRLHSPQGLPPPSLTPEKADAMSLCMSETMQGSAPQSPTSDQFLPTLSPRPHNAQIPSPPLSSPSAALPERRKTILRQPTFCWKSLSSSNSELCPPATQAKENSPPKTLFKFPAVSSEEAYFLPSPVSLPFSQPAMSQPAVARPSAPLMTQSVVALPSVPLPIQPVVVSPSLPLMAEIPVALPTVPHSSTLKQDTVATIVAQPPTLRATMKQPPVVVPSQPMCASLPLGKGDTCKRTPLLRAPQFTPSEAHLKIYESVSVPPNKGENSPSHDSKIAFAVRQHKMESRSVLYPEVVEPEHKKDSNVLTGPDSLTQTLGKPSPITSDLLVNLSSKPHPVARTNHLSLPRFAETAVKVEMCDKAKVYSGQGLIKIQAVDCPGVIRKVAIRRGSLPSAGSVPFKPMYAGDNSTPISEVESSDDDDDEDDALSPECKEEEESEEEADLAVPLSSMDEKMMKLLKTAKVQLSKIDKYNLRKLASPASSPALLKRTFLDSEGNCKRKSVVESIKAGKKTRSQGPRIKHVCRHASVALGQPRALTEDVPRLSALPLRDRDIIDLPLLVNESSSASESESIASRRKPGKVMTSSSVNNSRTASGRKRLRQGRCGRCKGCLHPDDCGKCVNCLDKPKFGGPNTKKQCCVHRRCDKIVARKQARMSQKGGRWPRQQPTRECADETDDEEVHFWKKECDETEISEQDPLLQRKSARRCVRQRPCYDVFAESEESDPDSKMGANTRKSSRESDYLPVDPDESSRPRKSTLQPVVHLKARKKTEKDLFAITTSGPLPNGCSGRLKPSEDGIHRIRIDFKEDCDVENVWQLGGLSVLTSVPVAPQLMCLLCASRGHHEMIYCQVCCEPFHQFCLEETERPLPEQEESWCCRRCKFCHVCGLKGKASKQLLECERCRNCYHLDCLGPNYPTKPFRKVKGWFCSTCVRCKSCGVSPAKNWETEWSSDFTLCPDCTSLFEKGNYCPICKHCYEENDYESKMIHCVTCQHWVHSKCEELTDEEYEILSNLPDSVDYTCKPCIGSKKAKWRDIMAADLQAGLNQVINELLASDLTTPIQQCSKKCCNHQEEKDPLNQPCDLQAVRELLDQGHYLSVKSFCDDVMHIIQQQINEESKFMKTRVGILSQTLFLQLMEKQFTWFQSQDAKMWQRSKSIPNGMLPNAVLPPSSDHIYAQCREREELHPIQNGLPGGKSPSPGTKRFSGSSCDIKSFDCKEEVDNRQCALCLKYGDDDPKNAGRLLYIGQNEWTHINCAIWSAEVFEENDGSLKNVHAAVARGRQMRCEHCQKSGATVGCCLSSCHSNFHFMCARANRCIFQDDKKMFCEKHMDLMDGEMVAADDFDVLRRVYVDFEGISFKRKFIVGLEPESIHMMIGSMKIDSLGMLSDLSACEGKLFPIGYQCSRLYWSTVDAKRRCWYKCRVLENRSTATTKELEVGEEPGTNQTIPHSPSVNADSCLLDVPIQREVSSCLPMEHTPALPNPGRVPPSEQTTTTPAPRSFSRARIKMPNYSPSRRPLGGSSRPLPSPGSPSSVSHHILTVSDPDVVPLRRARRHSPMSHGTTPRCRIASPPLTNSASTVVAKLSPACPISLRAGSSNSIALSGPDSSYISRVHELNKSTSSGSILPEIDIAVQTSTSGAQQTVHHHLSGAEPSYILNRSGTPSEMHGLLSFESPDVGAYQDLEYCDTVGSPGLLSPGGPLGSIVEDGQLVPGFCADAFDDSDMEVVSSLNVSDLEFDESVLDVNFQDDHQQCPTHSVAKADIASKLRDGSSDKGTNISGRHMVALNGAESSEDDDSQNSYSFSRTVVTRNLDLLPYSVDLQLPHIKQLDGIDDGTESDTSTANTSTLENTVSHITKTSMLNLSGPIQGGEGSTIIRTLLPQQMNADKCQVSTEKTPEDLPSDIVDFVLKDFSSGTQAFFSERNHSSPTLLLPNPLTVSENGSQIVLNVVKLPEVLTKPTKTLLQSLPVTNIEPLPGVPLKVGGSIPVANGDNGPLLRPEQLIASKPPEPMPASTPTWLSIGCHPIDSNLKVMNLKDPPQLQRVCTPLSLSPQVPTFTMAKLETPSVVVNKPAPNVLMLNKQGNVFVKVQANSLGPTAPTPDRQIITCQPVPVSSAASAPVVSWGGGEQHNFQPAIGGFSNQHSRGTACQRLDPTPTCSMRVMVIPQIRPCSQVVESHAKGTPRKVAPYIKKLDGEPNLGGVSSLNPAQSQPNLGTVFLRTSTPLGIVKPDAPTWTFRAPLLSVMPMVNMIRTDGPSGPSPYTIGTSSVMTQSVGLQQACVLHRLPITSGMVTLSTGLSTLRPSLLQGMSNFNLVESPATPLQVTASPKSNGTPTSPMDASPFVLNPSTPQPAICMKRASTFSNQSVTKKLKLEEEMLLPPDLGSLPIADCTQTISSPNNVSTGRVRIKTPTVKAVLDLDLETVKDEDLSDTESITSLIDLTSPMSPPETPEQDLDHMMEPKSESVSEPVEDPAAVPSTDSPWYKYTDDFSSSDEDVPVIEHSEPSKPHPRLRFEISNEDGFNVQAESIEIAWKAVVEKVQEARGIGRLKNISFTGMTGVRMLGLHHDAVIFLIEQLFGAERCRKYKFRFHQQEQVEEELPINPSGCARSEVYVRKCTFDMFNFLASRHRKLPESCVVEEEEDDVQLKSTRRATSLELPMAMRFRHLKRTSKEAVGVYRSAIHGRGLFCKRNIDAGEMVIEYSGIVIRSVLTDKREKFYDGKGIGCYMFRIDDFDVVDATMHGNAARFINHSCEPNCYSRVIHVEGQKHIVIFALRKIYRGEELTYDYKFPIEDPSNKLPCNCGAKKCRRFLN